MGRVLLFILSLLVSNFFFGWNNKAFAQLLPAIRSSVDTIVGNVPLGASCTNLQTDPDGCLLSNFNVVVYNATNDQKTRIFNYFSAPGRSASYLKMLKESGAPSGSPVKVYLINNTTCGGLVPGRGTIKLWGFSGRCGPEWEKYLIIHESGHIIASAHAIIGDTFTNFAFYPKDAICYRSYNSNYYLKTYAAEATSGGGGGRVESLAETFSEYIVYRVHDYRGWKLPNYPTDCSNGYQWAQNYIYSGVIF